MQAYDKMSFHAEDVDVVRRYAASRNIPFVKAMHSIAVVLEEVMDKKRSVRVDDFTIPPELPVQACIDRTHTVVTQSIRQPHLFSLERLKFKKEKM